ncbi:MAG: GNAT family N-acetyltransferase [Sulfolobaceae archaeon]|nr:GNAT family N-acetyltransferase [Sulfolobaceae archaeon]
MQRVRIERGTQIDIDELAKLADRVFRPLLLPGTGMKREFPLLFSPENASNLHYIRGDDNRPASLVAVKPWRVRIYESTVPVIAVGSVATLPEYRNRGYATEILKKVIRIYRRTHALMIISGNLDLYKRLGAVEFGTLYEIRIEKREHWKGKIYPADNFYEDFHNLYSMEDVRYERSLSETIALIDAIKAPYYRGSSLKGEVFVDGEREELNAYAVVVPYYTKRSLNLRIIEYAGNREGVLNIARYVLEYYDADSVTLRVQPNDSLLSMLHGDVKIRKVNNQGLILVLNPKLLINSLRLFLRHRLKMNHFEAEPAETSNSWHFRFDDIYMRLDGLDSISRYFFTEEGLNIPFPDTEGLNFI